MRGYKNIRIVVGDGLVIENGFITFGKTIEAVGPVSDSVAENQALQDGNGLTITPGIIDCHTHVTLNGRPNPAEDLQNTDLCIITLQAVRNCLHTLQAGITSIRDVGGRDYIDIKIRNAIRSGLVPGPRIQAAGKLICATGGHGWMVGREADGPSEIEKAVREQIKEGADLIKLIASGGILTELTKPTDEHLREEEMAAAVRMAKQYGRKTAAHALAGKSILNALRAGVDSIEHGVYLDDSMIEIMLAKQVYLVPTLSAPYHILEHGKSMGIPGYILEKTAEVFECHKQSFTRAVKAGVKIALGTDVGTPLNRHGGNLGEMPLMLRHGMDVDSAVRAATIDAARLLGIDHRVGSLEKGKLADAVVFRGNPLEDTQIWTDSTRLVEVFKEGEPL